MSPVETVTVSIQNHYEDGHSSEHEITAPAPADRTEAALEEWFEEHVWPHTGDGHSTTMNAVYSASITRACSTELIGITHEWN